MKTQTMHSKLPSIWDKMVHASFKKVVAFDLLFLGLGIAIGAGIGAFLFS
jgi:hypothetical protein